MKILKNLNIECLPCENRVAFIKKVDKGGEVYFFAHIYNDFGDFKEFVGSLFGFSYQSLGEQLKRIYKLKSNQIKVKREFGEFIEWYRNIAGHLPLEKTEILIEKFEKNET